MKMNASTLAVDYTCTVNFRDNSSDPDGRCSKKKHELPNEYTCTVRAFPAVVLKINMAVAFS